MALRPWSGSASGPSLKISNKYRAVFLAFWASTQGDIGTPGAVVREAVDAFARAECWDASATSQRSKPVRELSFVPGTGSY